MELLGIIKLRIRKGIGKLKKEQPNSAECDISSDEESESMSPNRRSEVDDHSKMIERAHRIAYSSKDNLIDERNNKNANIFTRTTIEVNSILVKKAQDDSYEKTKKSVRFNMDQIQLHEYATDNGDSCSQISLDDGTFIANVLDASDLLASDSELSEDETTETLTANGDVKFAFSIPNKKDSPELDPRSSFDSISSEDFALPVLPFDVKPDASVDELAKEKEKLQNDILMLRAEYDSEMKKLREEYQARRESYFTELDDLRHSIDERINSKLSEKKMKEVDNEEKRIDELESELEKRKKQCIERAEEIQEYEEYLDKRHASLSDKESDLNTLQDELDEFSRLLRKRDKDLKAKSERIDSEYEKVITIKTCTHDESEIQGLRDKVRELQNNVLKTKIDVEKKEEACREYEDKVNTLLLEQKKLQGKVKNLESQLMLDKKITQAKEDCNQIRRASVIAIGQLSPQRLAADMRSTSLNHKPLSASNSLRSISPGSSLEPDVFLNGKNKRKLSEAIESSNSDIVNNNKNQQVTEKRVDSRSIKSRTCVVM